MIKFSSIILALIFLSSTETININSHSRIKTGTIFKTEDDYEDSIESVVIGNQEWMKKNLNVETFQNGDSIPRAETLEEWKKAVENREPAWCYYDNSSIMVSQYGKLYNWYAVNDSRGLAPENWHVPSDKEWTALINYLGGEIVVKEKIKNTSGWKYRNGTNASGFSAEPSGGLFWGSFSGIGTSAAWWSSSEDDEYNAWGRILYSSDPDVGLSRDGIAKEMGLSVRCIKD